MSRPLPSGDRRVAEEAVRRGRVAAIVMEQAAREWTTSEEDETFLEFLVRREVLDAEGIAEFRRLVAEDAPAGTDTGEEAADASPRPVPPPSEVIEGYRILERLGRGGMGSVYRAVQLGMNRTVALKILRRPYQANEQHIQRLQREARLVGTLDHPHIVRGLDVGQSGAYHYFAMEFVEGETLRDRLRRRGPMPEAEVLRIVGQLCEALDHAYAKGVVHRDVKPGNIILTGDGVPKLTDYGLAKGPADFSLTQSGVTIGTPQYISPEQARDPIGVDIQTDLYSLGATAYHMLTGVPPHTSETLAGLLTKVLYEKPRTAKQVHPKVSAGASFLVEKLMAKQKRHRYRTPREVVADLRRLAAGRSIVPRGWTGDFEVHEIRSKYRVGVTAAVMVAVVALGMTLFFQHRARVLEQERLEREAEGAWREYIRDNPWPATRVGWETREVELRSLLLRNEGASAATREDIEAAMEQARLRQQDWEEAQALVARIREMVRQKDGYRTAEERIAEAVTTLARAGGETVDVREWLDAERSRLRQEGLAEADDLVSALERGIDRQPRVPGTVDWAAERLKALEDTLLDSYVREGTEPLERVRTLLAHLRVAREQVEAIVDQRLGERAEELLAAGDFLAVWQRIDVVDGELRENPELSGVLNRLPEALKAALVSTVDAWRTRVEDENATAVTALETRVGALRASRDYDAALPLLRQAADRTIPALRTGVDDLAAVVESERTEHRQRIRGLVTRLLDEVIDAVGGRDQRRAEAAIEDVLGLAGEEPVTSPLVRAVEAARRVVEAVERQAWERIRARARSGEGFPEGLEFRNLNDGIPYRGVEAVTVSESGAVLRFRDAGTGRWIEAPLRDLELAQVFRYAGLDEPEPHWEARLARAVLRIADGERLPRSAIEAARSDLNHVRDEAPQAGPALDALEVRAADLIARKLAVEQGREETAAEYHASALAAFGEGEPKEVEGYLGLLLGDGLRNTNYVKTHRSEIDDLAEANKRLFEQKAVSGIWPGAIIEEREDRTSARWEFEAIREEASFVRAVGSGPLLHRVRLPRDGDPGAADGFEGGHLVFLTPSGDQRLPDAPLALDVPFRVSRRISVAFLYRSAAPLYLQVSIAGSHVGILSDDGRITGGRGVHAWQDRDWRDPDRHFPEYHRNVWLRRNPDAVERARDRYGNRYFQFEKDRTYRIQIVRDGRRVQLLVDGERVWDQDLPGRSYHDDPARIHILTYTSCTLDALEVEGTIDKGMLRDIQEAMRPK